MSIDAGRLRHWLRFERPQTTQDATTGAMLKVWVTDFETFGELAPLSVREFIAAAGQQSEVSARVVIRYRQNVDATLRVIHRGQAFQVLGVLADPVSGLEYLTLPVAEGVRVA